MAIKGKKKSRGGQARRRPASAPRPVVGARRVSWYQTTLGKAILAILAVVFAGVLVWVVADERAESSQRAERREQLDSFTNDVRGFVQDLRQPAGEMATASTLPPDELRAKGRDWSEQFTAAQASATAIVPPEGLEGLSGMFVQVVLLYSTAADTYGVAGGLEGESQQAVIATAGKQFSSANAVFDSAVRLLDAERDEVGLEVSGVTAPGLAPPAPPSPTPAPAPEGGGGDDKEDSGGGG